MKKASLLLGILPAAVLIFGMGDAQAQRKNSTSKNAPAEVIEVDEEIVAVPDCKCKGKKDCGCAKGMMKKNKKMMKSDKKMQEEMSEINEDYQKALKKIDKSDFSAPQKEALKNQAMENKNLAEKQLQEKQQLIQKHRMANKDLMMQAKENKADRKALKEIREILD